jgi:hypothetical protein
VVQAPRGRIYPCALSPSGYATAGKHVFVPEQRLSGVSGLADYWRWLRAPLLGGADLDSTRPMFGVPAQPALLPDLVLAGRLDEVEVIGQALWL